MRMLIILASVTFSMTTLEVFAADPIGLTPPDGYADAYENRIISPSLKRPARSGKYRYICRDGFKLDKDRMVCIRPPSSIEEVVKKIPPKEEAPKVVVPPKTKPVTPSTPGDCASGGAGGGSGGNCNTERPDYVGGGNHSGDGSDDNSNTGSSGEGNSNSGNSSGNGSNSAGDGGNSGSGSSEGGGVGGGSGSTSGGRDGGL